MKLKKLTEDISRDKLRLDILMAKRNLKGAERMGQPQRVQRLTAYIKDMEDTLKKLG